MTDPAFLDSKNEYRRFQEDWGRFPREVLRDRDLFTATKTYPTKLAEVVRREANSKRHGFFGLVIRVDDDDGMSWSATAAYETLGSAQRKWDRAPLAGRLGQGFAPAVFRLIDEARLTRAAYRAGLLRRSSAERWPRRVLWLLLASLAAALLIGVGKALDLALRGDATGSPDIRDRPYLATILVLGVLTIVARRVEAKLTSSADPLGQIAAIVAKEVEAPIRSQAYDAFADEATALLGRKAAGRALVIDDFTQLDQFSKTVLLRYLDSPDGEFADELWIMFERSSSPELTARCRNQQRQGRWRRTMAYFQPNLSDAALADLARETGVPEAASLRVVGRVRSGGKTEDVHREVLRQAVDSLPSQEDTTALHLLYVLSVTAVVGGSPVFSKRELQTALSETRARTALLAAILPAGQPTRGQVATLIGEAERAFPFFFAEDAGLGSNELRLQGDKARTLLELGRGHVLPSDARINAYWALYWYDRYRHAPHPAVTRKLGLHLLRTVTGAPPTEQIRQSLYSATLYCIGNSLAAGLFADLPALLDLARNLGEGSSVRPLSRLAGHVYAITGGDEVLATLSTVRTSQRRGDADGTDPLLAVYAAMLGYGREDERTSLIDFLESDRGAAAHICRLRSAEFALVIASLGLRPGPGLLLRARTVVDEGLVELVRGAIDGAVDRVAATLQPRDQTDHLRRERGEDDVPDDSEPPPVADLLAASYAVWLLLLFLWSLREKEFGALRYVAGGNPLDVMDLNVAPLLAEAMGEELHAGMRRDASPGSQLPRPSRPSGTSPSSLDPALARGGAMGTDLAPRGAVGNAEVWTLDETARAESMRRAQQAAWTTLVDIALDLIESAVLLASHVRDVLNERARRTATWDVPLDAMVQELALLCAGAANYLSTQAGGTTSPEAVRARTTEVSAIASATAGVSGQESGGAESARSVIGHLEVLAFVWSSIGAQQLAVMLQSRADYLRVLLLPSDAPSGVVSSVLHGERGSLLQFHGDAALALSRRSTTALSVAYSVRAIIRAAARDLPSGLKVELALAAVRGAHAYGQISLDQVLRLLAEDLDEFSTHLRHVEDRDLKDDVLAMLNAFRSSTEPATIDALRSRLEARIAGISSAAEAAGIQTEFYLFDVAQRVTGEAVPDLEAEIDAWPFDEDRRDWPWLLYLLFSLWDDGQRSARLLQEADRAIARALKSGRPTWPEAHLAFAIAGAAARGNLDDEPAAALRVLEFDLETIVRDWSPPTSRQVLAILEQFGRSIPRDRLIELEAKELELRGASTFPELIRRREYYRLLRHYANVLLRWGMEVRATTSEPAPTEPCRAYLERWRADGEVIPPALLAEGKALNASFLRLGDCLFGPEVTNDDDWDDARQRVHAAAEGELHRLLAATHAVPGLPEPVRTILDRHRRGGVLPRAAAG